jgi:hypothetical protein
MRRLFSEGPRMKSGLMEPSPADYRYCVEYPCRQGKLTGNLTALVFHAAQSRTSLLVDHKNVATAFVDHFQGLAAAARYASERIFGYHHGQTGLFRQQTIQVAQ